MKIRAMKEEFLHYVWQYRKFDFSNLMTRAGEPLLILNQGSYLQQAGPDFFNALILIGSQKWAGNIEIHSKSSDWYLHHHENDTNYDNVILHVVWKYDMPVFRKDNSEIPVLELEGHVSNEIIESYKSLSLPKKWIFCENAIAEIDSFVLKNWQERLFFERLERKAIAIEELLQETENDWEAVLFCLLAKSFGLNTNGEAFLKMAKSIPFSVIRKESFQINSLESLFLGRTGLIPENPQDNYVQDLKNEFEYLTQKYQLKKVIVEQVQFFKHRPDNFPSIRLTQLAMLYHKQPNLFSKIISLKNLKETYQLFHIETSDYWQTHYQFDKESPKKRKSLSKSFIDLLTINTIIPIQFAFVKNQGKEVSESLLDLLKEVAAEKNVIIDKFSAFGIKAANAFETQSLLQLKNEYCNHGKCLQCAIGIQLLKE